MKHRENNQFIVRNNALTSPQYDLMHNLTSQFVRMHVPHPPRGDVRRQQLAEIGVVGAAADHVLQREGPSRHQERVRAATFAAILHSVAFRWDPHPEYVSFDPRDLEYAKELTELALRTWGQGFSGGMQGEHTVAACVSTLVQAWAILTLELGGPPEDEPTRRHPGLSALGSGLRGRPDSRAWEAAFEGAASIIAKAVGFATTHYLDSAYTDPVLPLGLCPMSAHPHCGSDLEGDLAVVTLGPGPKRWWAIAAAHPAWVRTAAAKELTNPNAIRKDWWAVVYNKAAEREEVMWTGEGS